MSDVAATHVRRVSGDDSAELGAFSERNRAFHGNELTLPPDAAAWYRLVDDPMQRWYRADTDGGLVGILSLSRWSGAPWSSAELGAGADRSATGRGLLSAALRTLLEIELLHGELERVEALIRPENTTSERFVAAAGLRYEGLARHVLWLEGRRIDMGRWAVVRADLMSPTASGGE